MEFQEKLLLRFTDLYHLLNTVVRISFSLVVVVVVAVMAPLFPLPFPVADIPDVVCFTML